MPFAEDDFTDTPGSNLTAHTVPIGGPWVLQHLAPDSPQFSGSGDKVYATGNATVYASGGVPASADYTVEGSLYHYTADAGLAAVCARMETGSFVRYQFAMDASATWRLQRIASDNTATDLDTFAEVPADDTFILVKIECIGDQIKGYVDGVERCAATDAIITAAGFSGLRFSGGSGYKQFTSFAANDVGGAGPPGTVILYHYDALMFGASL